MKIWLITGCSSGIGKGIAKAVLKNGDTAIITARSILKLEDLRNEYPDTACPQELDVTNHENVNQVVKAILEKYGRIDVLVNNAGHGYRAAVEEGEADQVQELFQTNFFGPVELIKKVLPYMRKQQGGAIVNISSIGAVSSGMGSGYYAASKAAIELLSDSLYHETKGLGIKVMIVEPGAFRTNFYNSSMKGTEREIEAYNEALKNRRKGNDDTLDQPGDPDKAGEVIVKSIALDNPPERLILGKDAVDKVRKMLTRRIAELETWEKISGQSDY